jgi:hypothetical protein
MKMKNRIARTAILFATVMLVTACQEDDETQSPISYASTPKVRLWESDIRNKTSSSVILFGTVDVETDKTFFEVSEEKTFEPNRNGYQIVPYDTTAVYYDYNEGEGFRYQAVIDELKSDRIYFARLKTINKENEAFSDTISFKTKVKPDAKLTTLPVTNVLYNQGLFHGFIERYEYIEGNYRNPFVNFEFSLTPDFQQILDSLYFPIDYSKQSVEGDTVSYTVYDFKSGEKYYYRSLMMIGDHEAIYGDVVSFTTKALSENSFLSFSPTLAKQNDEVSISSIDSDLEFLLNFRLSVMLNNTSCEVVSRNNSTITFRVPENMPEGKYLLSVTYEGTVFTLSETLLIESN